MDVSMPLSSLVNLIPRYSVSLVGEVSYAAGPGPSMVFDLISFCSLPIRHLGDLLHAPIRERSPRLYYPGPGVICSMVHFNLDFRLYFYLDFFLFFRCEVLLSSLTARVFLESSFIYNYPASLLSLFIDSFYVDPWVV